MIGMASDHAGFPLKEAVKQYLEKKGVPLLDLGAVSEDSCDYPDFAQKAARAVLAGECEKALLFCGTGVGISIAANRFRGIRCVVCSEACSAALARHHNDANMLALGARIVGEELAFSIVESFLSAPFDGGERHPRRLEKIENTGL